MRKAEEKCKTKIKGLGVAKVWSDEKPGLSSGDSGRCLPPCHPPSRPLPFLRSRPSQPFRRARQLVSGLITASLLLGSNVLISSRFRISSSKGFLSGQGLKSWHQASPMQWLAGLAPRMQVDGSRTGRILPGAPLAQATNALGAELHGGIDKALLGCV